ncbi:unnamed protein product [Spirodela intermedia]|uniref:Uncharacterized protein n=1 Tax=Spirodela intermedia TaxID=51605 RepID=A0A7I8LDU8_SPIIN|nr:unnamed protein product [Spirodela intermedia]
MRSRPPILRHLKIRLREGLEYPEENKKKIKAWSIAFSCLKSSWRRDYLGYIKNVMDQASLGLGLAHNEIYPTLGSQPIEGE